ncbi:hypothetical protein ACFLRM_01240 [Acidobacteriota bacterium]
MKKKIFLLISLGLFCLSFQLPSAQTEKQSSTSYKPAGRRDPFRDLLAGRDVKEESAIEGIGQISVDNVVLKGIVKARGKFTAIISGPQGLSYYINEGDKFFDGFLLSIQKKQIVFRKTRQKGFPLFKPRNVVKEINPEEH